MLIAIAEHSRAKPNQKRRGLGKKKNKNTSLPFGCMAGYMVVK
jgi:hypothetical protein